MNILGTKKSSSIFELTIKDGNTIICKDISMGNNYSIDNEFKKQIIDLLFEMSLFDSYSDIEVIHNLIIERLDKRELTELLNLIQSEDEEK